MSEKIIRRRRRRKLNFTDAPKSDLPDLSNPVESTEFNTEQIENATSLIEPSISKPHKAIDDNNINSIRAELLEDTHHSDFAESNYSDDTHDWGWDSPEISSEYWHFVGRYE